MERHGGTEARVRRLLAKRVASSREEHGEPSAEDAAAMIDEVVAKLVRLGYVNDARFAEQRAKTLRKRGKSARAIRSALARQGVDSAVADDVIDEGDELAAARAYVRRRRLKGGDKDLAKLARAGFSYDVARRALETDR